MVFDVTMCELVEVRKSDDGLTYALGSVHKRRGSYSGDYYDSGTSMRDWTRLDMRHSVRNASAVSYPNHIMTISLPSHHPHNRALARRDVRQLDPL